MLAAVLPMAGASEQPYAVITETTQRPLRKIFDCRGAPSSAHACGPAVASRTTWPDLCDRNADGSVSTVDSTGLAVDWLRGQVLDIVLIPDEDETLFLLDGDGNTYIGGMVGEVITDIAKNGGFEFNAIVVDPPDNAYEGGSWTLWAEDWSNRADLIAAWFYDSKDRRARGLVFPYNFYQLSPVLVAHETTVEISQSITEEYFQFMLPFSWGLWGAILLMLLLCTLALGFIEERLFIAPREVRRADGRILRCKCAVLNLKAWLYEFFLLVMAFCQAGGWWGMSNAVSASGRFLSLFTEFGILIILAAYLGNITNLMLREQRPGTTLSSDGIEEILSARRALCYREATALGEVIRKMIPDEALRVNFGNASGGFAGHGVYGAGLLRSEQCDAMVLPQWFAENLMVPPPPIAATSLSPATVLTAAVLTAAVSSSSSITTLASSSIR